MAREQGCAWRQPVSSLTLAPAGERGSSRTYGFKLRWADDYEGVRQVLVEEGLVDVNVVPGMTVPTDLSARIALRSREPIHSVEAEFPGRPELRSWVPGTASTSTRSASPGSGRIGSRSGSGMTGTWYLEFFCTEPLETLIAKRAAFIAAHQHRDPALWYDGLLAEWNMESQVLLGPDNYDRIKGWRIYEVTCDDPGLSKPAFLASKNAEYPGAGGGGGAGLLHRELRLGRASKDHRGDLLLRPLRHSRLEDQPGERGPREERPPTHLEDLRLLPHHPDVLRHVPGGEALPHIRTALSSTDYLRRAYGTALAMFTVPSEVERWSAYGTGLYNELVIPHVIAALEAEGMRDEAERLRPHWERKVRTFVNDRPDLFRSEYAFDSTGFEATHALAKYALQVAEPGPVPEGEVRVGWVDYPAPTKIPLENAREFMDMQMAANLFCRGWLETAYYLPGERLPGWGREPLHPELHVPDGGLGGAGLWAALRLGSGSPTSGSDTLPTSAPGPS